MPGRLVHKADFERLLGTRSRSRSAHFAVHHLTGAPSVPKRPARSTSAEPFDSKLSTAEDAVSAQVVDNYPAVDPACALSVPASSTVAALPHQWWLGCVVPKRHARRAVTRNLLKRQIRSAFARHAGHLPAGLWLVRLSAGFPVTQFVSARSKVLGQAAASELDALLARVS